MLILTRKEHPSSETSDYISQDHPGSGCAYYFSYDEIYMPIYSVTTPRTVISRNRGIFLFQLQAAQEASTLFLHLVEANVDKSSRLPGSLPATEEQQKQRPLCSSRQATLHSAYLVLTLDLPFADQMKFPL
jgi:hypothetical protein